MLQIMRLFFQLLTLLFLCHVGILVIHGSNAKVSPIRASLTFAYKADFQVALSNIWMKKIISRRFEPRTTSSPLYFCPRY